MMAAFFWTSGAMLVYVYLGYPLLLALRGRRRSLPDRGDVPFVSVIVAAYNEEACIGEKVKNVLEHDYPADRLELLVVSDGSTDATEAIVAGLAGPRVRLLSLPARQGKNMALNRAAREARGEVLVFTDANAMLAPGSLRRLVAPFADPAVGLVSGQGLYGEGGHTTRVVTNAYVRYESFIKRREAALGFLAAADGALYAMRPALYAPLRRDQVHDLAHPIQVALAGARSAFVAEAVTVEPPSRGAASEFHRQVRIIAQGFRIFLTEAPRLLWHGRLLELWMLASHRLLRWISALFLVVALGTNLQLLGRHPVYALCLMGQSLFYGTALAGAVAERLGMPLRILAVPYYFCVVSAAGIRGFFHFLLGRGHATWLPAEGR